MGASQVATPTKTALDSRSSGTQCRQVSVLTTHDGVMPAASPLSLAPAGTSGIKGIAAFEPLFGKQTKIGPINVAIVIKIGP